MEGYVNAERMNYAHEEDHAAGPSLPHHAAAAHHAAVHHHHHHHGAPTHHHGGEEEEHHRVDEVDDLGEEMDEEDDDQDDLSASHLGHDLGHVGEEDDDMMSAMRQHRKSTVKRRTKSAQQIMILMSHFNRDPKPKKVAIKALVLSTGLTYPEICRWFRNQRLRSKSSMSSLASQQAAMQQMQQLQPSNQVMQQQHPGVLSQQHPSVLTQQHQNVLPPHPSLPQLSMQQTMLAEEREMHKVHQQIPGMMPLGLQPPAAAPAPVETHASMLTLAGTPSTEGVKEEKTWRASSKFRRTRDTFLSILNEFPRGSPERDQLLKDMVRTMSRSDRESLQALLRPRGPYRGSADPALKMTTKQERAKDVWSEMERRFGAHGRTDDGDEQNGQMMMNATIHPNGLDANMVEGLKVLFKPHRDYLFAVARELEVTDMLKPEVETELKRKFAVKQARRQELERQKRDKRKVAPNPPTTNLLKAGIKRVRSEMSPPPGPTGPVQLTRTYMQHDQHGVPYGGEF